MQMKISLITALALLFTSTAFAQEREADDTNSPRAYPAAQSVSGGPAMNNFDAAFEESSVGFMHVYAVDVVDPEGTYLLGGDEMSGTELAVLPNKITRLAERKDAKMYAATAIRGVNEALYLTRMDGEGYDRIDMFAIRGDEVRHLKTLALRDCRNDRCRQLDSWITDIDGNTNLDLMQMGKKRNGRTKKVVYTMDDQRNWAKTDELDAPWDSAEME